MIDSCGTVHSRRQRADFTSLLIKANLPHLAEFDILRNGAYRTSSVHSSETKNINNLTCIFKFIRNKNSKK